MDRTSVGHNIDVPLSLTPSVQNDIYIYIYVIHFATLLFSCLFFATKFSTNVLHT